MLMLSSACQSYTDLQKLLSRNLFEILHSLKSSALLPHPAFSLALRSMSVKWERMYIQIQFST
jgi:hypothetical protein